MAPDHARRKRKTPATMRTIPRNAHPPVAVITGTMRIRLRVASFRRNA
jgi:hypothetical protein